MSTPEHEQPEQKIESLQGQEAAELVIRLLTTEPWVITQDRLPQPVRLTMEEFAQVVDEYGDVELFYPDWRELFITGGCVTLAAGGIKENYKTIGPEGLGTTEEWQTANQIEQLWEKVDSITPLSHIRQFGDEQDERRSLLKFFEQEAKKYNRSLAEEVEAWYNAYIATWEEET